MFKLSERLNLIARLVPYGSNVVDVGTDHGYLAIYLKKSGIANNVTACDINKAPLENAAANAKKYGVDINLCLCDGLEKIEPSVTDTVIIAGMGAEVICGIVSRAQWLKDSSKTLILQPMNSPELLREFICQNGFSLTNEQAVIDNGRIYTVISAVYSGNRVYDINYYYTGRLLKDRDTDRIFIQKQLKRISDWLEFIKQVPTKKNEYKMLCGVKEHLVSFLEE